MSNRQRVLSSSTWLIVATVFLAAIAIVPAAASWKDIRAHWSPRLFLSEYLKALGYILPVVYGFILLNVYWERRVEVERAHTVKRIFQHYTYQLSGLLDKARERLEKRVTSEREADRRVEEVKSYLEQAVWISQTLRMLHTIAIGRVSEQQTMDTLTWLCFSVLPRVDALRYEVDIRPGNLDLKAELVLLVEQIDHWNRTARGGFDESRPAGRSPG